jgi:hypothetical protein
MSPLGGNTTGTGAYGLLELQKSTLLERLVAAEERAREAERTNEQLRDQIKTMDWGGMLAVSASAERHVMPSHRTLSY